VALEIVDKRRATREQVLAQYPAAIVKRRRQASVVEVGEDGDDNISKGDTSGDTRETNESSELSELDT
jgi:hypothetical protein